MSKTSSKTATTIVATPPKSMLAAFLLAFFFGPLGLLYASVAGGLVLIVLAFVIVPITGGLGALIVWPASVVWALVSAAASHGSTSS